MSGVTATIAARRARTACAAGSASLSLPSGVSWCLRLPVAAAEDGWQTAGEARGWGPIGVLSGMAERFGTAVSETIGIEVEQPPAHEDER